MSTIQINSFKFHYSCIEYRADPGASKGRGTNRLSYRWLGRARLVLLLVAAFFEAANNHLLVVSHC